MIRGGIRIDDGEHTLTGSGRNDRIGSDGSTELRPGLTVRNDADFIDKGRITTDKILSHGLGTALGQPLIVRMGSLRRGLAHHQDGVDPRTGLQIEQRIKTFEGTAVRQIIRVESRIVEGEIQLHTLVLLSTSAKRKKNAEQQRNHQGKHLGLPCELCGYDQTSGHRLVLLGAKVRTIFLSCNNFFSE